MTRPTPAPAAQAAAGDVWRAVDGDGTVHDVAVERVPPPEWAGWWRVVGTRGTSLASMSPRASVVLWAMDRMGIAEILSPGEPSRAELTADLARLRALFAAGESIDVAGVVARLRAATAYCERDCAKPVSVAGGDVVNACDAIEHLQAECGAARTREELDRTVMGRELAALRESDAAHDAAVAAARAEALREARDAVLARIVDHDGRNESAGVLPSVYARIIVEDCAAAVAALAAPRGR